MKIGVVSDTHSLKIPAQLLKDFQNVDLIVHAGDFCSESDYQLFKKIKDVKAVYGNMDEKKLCTLLSRRQVFECAGVMIGVFHGEGARLKVLEIVLKEFQKDKVQVVIFGHTHQPLNEKMNGVLYFNPGSPNDRINAPFCSYGILEIKDGQATGHIVKVKETNG